MYDQNLFSLQDLQDGFNAIEPEIIRFPSLDSEILRTKVKQFIESCNTQAEESE